MNANDVLINRYLILGLAIVTILAIGILGFRFKQMVGGMLSRRYLNYHAKVKSIEYAPNAIITSDDDGNIVSWNKGAEAVLGWKESEVLGKPLTIIIPEKDRAAHQEGIARLKRGETPRIIGKSVDMVALHRLGEELAVELTLWQWKEGPQAFYTGIIKNLAERKALQTEYNNLRVLYTKGELIDNSGICEWILSGDTGDKIDKVIITEGFARIYGIDLEVYPSEYLIRKVYFEDKQIVKDAIKRVFLDKKDFRIEYRIHTGDGTIKKIRSTSKTYFKVDTPECELQSIISVIHIIA